MMGIIDTSRSLLRRWLKPPLHKIEVAEDYAVLGSIYGGWPLILNELNKDSIIYSFGVGEDISFDCAAIKRLGCQVEAFDPTPRSLAWVSRQNPPKGFQFHSVGVAAIDGEVSFFEPVNELHVSFSDAPSRGSSGRSVVSPVKRVSTLMGERDHESIDVLKMDIEGFEYAVIDEVLGQSSIRPAQWLIEFHHGMYGKSSNDTRRAVANLRQAGYQIFYISSTGREYGFVRRRPGSEGAVS